MATNRVYPTDLLPEEEAAGFKLVEIENPEAHYHGKPKKVWAIVFQVDRSYRVVKTANPSARGYFYNLEMFSVFLQMQNQPPEWHPVKFDGNGAPPALVTEVVAAWIAANPNKHWLLRVPEEENAVVE